MIDSFITQELNEFTEYTAAWRARIEAKVAAAREEVLATIDGIGLVASGAKTAPRVSAAEPRKGAKRSPIELEALTATLHKYIAKHPDGSIEQIGRGMGVSTKDLRLPILKLLADKQIASKGQKRATRYRAR